MPIDNQNADPAGSVPTRQSLAIIGQIIRTARGAMRPFLNQTEFYGLCRKLENPEFGRRKGVAFPADNETSQRKFIIALEKGRVALTPPQKRIIEGALGWPNGALDGTPTSDQEFKQHCAQLSEARKKGSDTEDAIHVGDEPQLAKSAATIARTPVHQRGKRRQARPRRNHLGGIRTIANRQRPLPSRAAFAREIQEGLLASNQETLRIVVVQGEAGVGKTQLIAEWWRDLGRQEFTRNTFALDCSRLGGDQILQEVNAFFLSKAASVPTTDLVEAINGFDNVLIVLDGLSDESGLGIAGRADRVALNRVRETLNFFASNGIRASILLGIQADEKTEDALRIADQLNAATSVIPITVTRLPPEEGARMVKDLGIKNLSDSDLRHLSTKLEGLPISLAAAAHYLSEASPRQAESFLIEIDSRGRNFKFFEEFFGRYLEALNQGPFDKKAHPHAYLRLLALMPGNVTTTRVDELLSQRRIVRLENSTTETFSKMRINFLVEHDGHIDINPMVRGLLRQEIKSAARQGGNQTISREELYWIHASAAILCIKRLPQDASKVSTVEIEFVEGTLYHLLELRDYLPENQTSEWRPSSHRDWEGLFDGRADADAITQYCLIIVRRFLVDPYLRTTRFLGQYETKARLLSLFFESEDDGGQRKTLSLPDRAFVYTEMGVCWMHAGRLQLAQDALDHAVRCIAELDVSAMCAKPLNTLTEQDKDLWRTWSNLVSTMALILMRLGRPREMLVEPSLSRAATFAERLAREALGQDTPIESLQQVMLQAARRVLCRKGNIALNGGDRTAADEIYRFAEKINALVGEGKLTGDALRRQIEALVLRGPCFHVDIELAEALLDPHLVTVPHRRLSNDIIAMFTTKIMLLRAKGNFAAAAELIGKIEQHEFILRAECPFTARIEFELEKYKLKIAMDEVSPAAQRALRLIAEELHARRHLMLYWDAMLLIAESEDEPKRTEILDLVERQSTAAGWLRRRDAIEWMRTPGGNAVQAFGC